MAKSTQTSKQSLWTSLIMKMLKEDSFIQQLADQFGKSYNNRLPNFENKNSTDLKSSTFRLDYEIQFGYINLIKQEFFNLNKKLPSDNYLINKIGEAKLFAVNYIAKNSKKQTSKLYKFRVKEFDTYLNNIVNFQ